MSEEYLELYKKYRPKVWGDLVGQPSASSLQRLVVADKVPSLLLFAGERGTGKTSAAMLLAKSLNCLNRADNGDPCNECDVCFNIDNGTQLGVTYVSMANNGGVDSVRELTRQATLTQPIKQQVFILDEVHNLGKIAQDALLIPMEDPKMKSLFIFCTTEVNKVQPALLSRAQQRSFTMIEAPVMSRFVAKIGKLEGLELSDDIISAAVRMGRGSARDTLTSLESILASGAESGASFGNRLIEAIAALDTVSVLKVVAEANREGVDMRDLAEQTYRDLGDILLSASGVDESVVGVIPVDDPMSIARKLGGQSGMVHIMTEIGTATTQMSMGSDGRIMLEMALIRGLATLRKAMKNKAT